MSMIGDIRGSPVLLRAHFGRLHIDGRSADRTGLHRRSRPGGWGACELERPGGRRSGGVVRDRLANFQLSGSLACEVLEDRGHHPARPASRRPQVDQDHGCGPVGVEDGVGGLDNWAAGRLTPVGRPSGRRGRHLVLHGARSAGGDLGRQLLPSASRAAPMRWPASSAMGARAELSGTTATILGSRASTTVRPSSERSTTLQGSSVATREVDLHGPVGAIIAQAERRPCAASPAKCGGQVRPEPHNVVRSSLVGLIPICAALRHAYRARRQRYFVRADPQFGSIPVVPRHMRWAPRVMDALGRHRAESGADRTRR